MTLAEKVDGEWDEHDVKVFTISTCAWCKKVKKLLKSLDVQYRYIDIDVLRGEEKDEIKEELKEYNPKLSCPTLVIDEGEEVIIGHQEEKIKEVLGDEG
ncbi:MAG: glutathione S-transferase N-terminal domain-containing protein [Candidatus Thermoplasmatota archaeon]|nr:glutathione S-transferase N-terminal domain-containing protein [Candidatus Thermoplasmatota archaeon]